MELPVSSETSALKAQTPGEITQKTQYAISRFNCTVIGKVEIRTVGGAGECTAAPMTSAAGNYGQYLVFLLSLPYFPVRKNIEIKITCCLCVPLFHFLNQVANIHETL